MAADQGAADLSRDPTAPPYRGKSVYGAPLRDVRGYGAHPPNPKWPKGAKVALQLVLNYEEGGENCLLHTDAQSEHLLSEIVGAAPYPDQRHVNMESLYEYGSRSGFWRLHRLLTKYNTPVTVFAVAMALERNPDAAEAMKEAGWEVASHGYRWIDYQNVDEATERQHIKEAIRVHESLGLGKPKGIYQGKPNQNTRRLVVEENSFLWDADSYADDLPYWNTEHGRPHLIVPYTLSENDMRFAIPNGWTHGGEFSEYLIDNLNYLLEEGRSGAPKMMSVGLHCRLVGRPGRAAGLQRFLEYVKSLGDEVWVCTRSDIAEHWYRNFWPEGHGPCPVPEAGSEGDGDGSEGK